VLLIAIAILIAAVVALLIGAAGMRLSDRVDIRSSMNLVAAQTLTPIALVLSEQDRRSLFERALKPLLKKAVHLGGLLTPPGYVASVQKRLILAGRSSRIDFDRYLAGRFVSIALLPLLVLVMVVLSISSRIGIVTFLFLGLVLVLGPDAYLNRQVTARQERIRSQLPDILDLLTISVEAGLGFEQALSRTVVTVPGPLSAEFARMLQETRLGLSRREAFESVAERTNVPELHAFLVALNQAETLGISVMQILRSQSIEIRSAQRMHAQEKAQKAPVKMMFPLVFCILPALFVVVVGPAAIEIYHTVIKPGSL